MLALQEASATAPFVLRAYQWEGIDWLRKQQRVMLCDQPRLGKTCQAVFASEPPVLIACPSYLTLQWYDALLSFNVPANKISLATGTHTQRQDALDAHADWYICNTEMLRRFDPFIDEKGVKHVPYRFQIPRTFIVDESHHLRGYSSLQSKGAFHIGAASGHKGIHAERVYLLTGTPVLNRPDDLFAQLRILDPKRFTSYWQFINTYCKVVDIGFGPKVVGSKDPDFYKPLNELFAQYSLTRTAEDVGLQLSALTEQLVRVQPSPEFIDTYTLMKQEYLDADLNTLDNLSQAYTHLRRVTVQEKIKALLTLIVDGNLTEGCVIFTKYKTTARLLAKALKAACITGEESQQQRRALMQDSLIVATQESLTEGVDLPHIFATIFFEHDHVPGLRYQCLSRSALCPRPRHVYDLVVAGTIDEQVYQAITDRTMTIRTIVREALRP